MNAGTILVEVISAAGGTAGVGGFFLALLARKDKERETTEELRRTVEAAKTKTAIEAAIASSNAPLLERFDQNDELTRATVRRVDALEQSQFGKNGGGLREQVNKTDAKVDILMSEQSSIKERVATVEALITPSPVQRRPRAVKSL